jgi:hypothetical protein
MARFRATIKGQRGEASRLGSLASGLSARVNGWDSGVLVRASGSHTHGDEFCIYMTSGSIGRDTDVYLGRVAFHEGKIRWIPAP